MTLIDINKWQEIFSTIKQNKLRTLLTAFGVGWGILLLIILIGAGNGLRNGVMSNFGNQAVNSGFMWAERTSVPYAGYPRDRRWSIHNKDINKLKKGIKEIDIISPQIHGGGYRNNTMVERKDKEGAYTIQGIYSQEMLISPRNIMYGRYINKLDNDNQRKVMVIGKQVYQDLYEKDENPIGTYMPLNDILVKVVGVMSSLDQGRQAIEDNQGIYMPFTTVQKIYNYGQHVHAIGYIAKQGVSIETIEKKCRQILGRIHHISPDDERAFGSWNRQEWYKKMAGLFVGINTLLWVVGIGTLIAGIIGVSNIMLFIIKERTREIGIQRAIGATPGKIISHIISESLFITTVAGYLGLFVGVLIIEGISKMLAQSGGGEGGGESMFKNPEVDLSIALISLAILIVSGIIAGFIPARKALKVRPIEAIRTE